MKIEISDDDLWTMLLSTVRYSMGRMTYMTSVAPDLVWKYQDRLSIQQLTQVRDEVVRELELAEKLGGTVGMQMDHDSWRKFARELAETLEKRA